MEVNLCQENQKDDDDLMLGSSLHSYLLQEDDSLAGTAQQAQFYVHVHEFLFKLVGIAVKRLQFEDTVLNDLVWLDS